MIPHEQEWKVYPGDSETLFFRVFKRDAEGNKVYTALTGTPKCEVKAERGASQPVVATLVVSLGDQVTYPGAVLVTMLPAVSATMSDGYVYDVQLEVSETEVHTFLTGTIKVPLDEVTT